MSEKLKKRQEIKMHRIWAKNLLKEFAKAEAFVKKHAVEIKNATGIEIKK